VGVYDSTGNVTNNSQGAVFDPKAASKPRKKQKARKAASKKGKK
jgi:hypothetical protein